LSKERSEIKQGVSRFANQYRISFAVSAQNKAAMAPTIPATLKLLSVRPTAPLLLLPLEGEDVLEVLVELLRK